MPRGTSGSENANSNYAGKADRDAAQRAALAKNRAGAAQTAGRGSRKI